MSEMEVRAGLEKEVEAERRTSLDRQLVAPEPLTIGEDFGAEVRDAMDRRVDYLVEQGLAPRQGQSIAFARDLLNTLRQRELDSAIAKLSAETGLAHELSTKGECVAGVHRQRVTFASGRFAMIDDGLGFQLVPWRPALENRPIGQQALGVMTASGVEWNFDHQRALASRRPSEAREWRCSRLILEALAGH